MRSSPAECILVFIRGTFSCAQIDLRKARERELATLDEKPRSSGIAEPYLCAITIKGKNRGEEGTTPLTTAYSEAGKSGSVREKKKGCTFRDKMFLVMLVLMLRLSSSSGDYRLV